MEVFAVEQVVKVCSVVEMVEVCTFVQVEAVGEGLKNKNVHVPKMQHNTTKIFQLIYMIYSFFNPHCDENIFIKNIRIKIK